MENAKCQGHLIPRDQSCHLHRVSQLHSFCLDKILNSFPFVLFPQEGFLAEQISFPKYDVPLVYYDSLDLIRFLLVFLGITSLCRKEFNGD